MLPWLRNLATLTIVIRYEANENVPDGILYAFAPEDAIGHGLDPIEYHMYDRVTYGPLGREDRE
jgi:hypothetical protein